MNVGAQAFRMVQAAVRSEKVQYAQERFLADIVNQFPGAQTIAQGEADDARKMRHEMAFRFGIAIPQPAEVRTIKGRLVQGIRITGYDGGSGPRNI